CQSSVEISFCNATYDYSGTSGPPFAKGSIATITCHTNQLQAECLGEPYGWYIGDNAFDKCQGCSNSLPQIPCSQPRSSEIKSSYCRGERIQYITIVTNVTFIGASCEGLDQWTIYELPKPAGVSSIFSYNERCFYIPAEAELDWLSSETYCQDKFNGSIALPESQELIDKACAVAVEADIKRKLWVGPNIMGVDYICDDSKDPNECLSFWKYPNNTEIPSGLFTDAKTPNKDQKKMCLIIETNKLKIKNENCDKDDKIPLCEVNYLHSVNSGCMSGINLQNSTNTTFTYAYENESGTVYPRGSTANVTCTIDVLNCQRTFQAECGGRYGWYFKLFNMSHLEFCEPCADCDYSPPDPTPCTRLVKPFVEGLPYSHGDAVQYEILGKPELVVSAICNDGYWEFPGIPQEFLEFDGKCYFLSPNTTTFIDAAKACRQLVDGHLAYPESRDQLYAIQNHSSTELERYYMAPHTTNVVHSCATPEECSTSWTYPNGTNISLTLFTPTENEPDATARCIELFDLDGLRTAPCNESKHFVCMIDESQSFVEEPGDCLYPPPKTPCGIKAEEIHQAPYEEGENFKFTCPDGSEANATCMNGTWVGGCEEYPHVFAIGDECYLVRRQMDTIENQALFCNNLSQGYLAPANSYNVSLADLLEPSDRLFLGTQLTSNQDAYTCEPQTCASLWTEENNGTWQVTHNGAKKACLVLDRNGLASYQCQEKAFALCRVFSGSENSRCGELPYVTDHVTTNQLKDFGTRIDVDYSCPCDNGTGTVPAVCLGHPVGWLFPQGIHICETCTTTESTTMETSTDSTTLPSTTDNPPSTPILDYSTSTPNSVGSTTALSVNLRLRIRRKVEQIPADLSECETRWLFNGMTILGFGKEVVAALERMRWAGQGGR
ncbi:unnamed protein product, partial [Cyprideis torosa]